MPKVSIIVPVYNVEKYLPTCIDSILAQSYDDFELILVDDGSTDSSGEICDRYAVKYGRTIVIHKKNGGLSDARNTGINKAIGKYLLFVDSDDYIEPDTIKNIVNLAEANQSDMVIFGYFADVIDKKNNIISHKNCAASIILTEQRKIAKAVVSLKRNFVFDSACNKLYLARIVKENNLQMPIGELFEDTGFNLNVFPYLEKVVITSACYYHYMQRNSERITNTYSSKKYEFLKKRHLALIAYLSAFFQSFSNEIRQANYIYVKYIFSCMIDLFMPEADLNQQERKQLFKRYRTDLDLQIALKSVIGFSKLDNVIIWAMQRKSDYVLWFLARIGFLLKYRYKKIFFRLKDK